MSHLGVADRHFKHKFCIWNLYKHHKPRYQKKGLDEYHTNQFPVYKLRIYVGKYDIFGEKRLFPVTSKYDGVIYNLLKIKYFVLNLRTYGLGMYMLKLQINLENLVIGCYSQAVPGLLCCSCNQIWTITCCCMLGLVG